MRITSAREVSVRDRLVAPGRPLWVAGRWGSIVAIAHGEHATRLTVTTDDGTDTVTVPATDPVTVGLFKAPRTRICDLAIGQVVRLPDFSWGRVDEVVYGEDGDMLLTFVAADGDVLPAQADATTVVNATPVDAP